MTLILTCLTPNYLMQVSDRRLSTPVLRKPVGDVNKAVVWNSTLILAFTGIAQVEGQSTDSWAAQAMMRPDRSIPKAVDDLGRAAARVPELRKVPLAIVGACYSTVGKEKTLTPSIVTVSNFLNEYGEPVGIGPWRYSGYVTDNEGAYVWAHGVHLPMERRLALAKTIKAKAMAKPRYAADVLSGAVVQVSERDRTVSSDVLVSCLPRAASGQWMRLMTTPPNLETASFTSRVGGSVVDHPKSPTMVMGTTLLTGINFVMPREMQSSIAVIGEGPP
jgi:hypothetical protein